MDRKRTPPPESGVGMGSASGQAETPQVPFTPKMQTPLFTEEQVRQMAILHSQAPWLYNDQQPRAVFPTVCRPSFLEREEARLDAESTELAMMKSYMKHLIAQNEELTRRLQMLESKRGKDGMDQEVELSFSAPNGSLQDDPKEAERPPKEAAERPPKEAAEVNEEEQKPKGSGASESKGNTPPFQIPSTDPTGFAEKSMEFMVLMMENMKELQRKFSEDREEAGSVRGISKL